MSRIALLLIVALCLCNPALAQRTPPWQSLNDESLALFQQGKYDRSTEVAKKGLEMVERLQGAEHQGAAIFMDRIAENYRQQARFSEAGPLYESSLRIVERTLGPEHFRTAIVRTHYGVMLVAQGKHVEGEQMLDRALDLRTRKR